jgi:Asp-tRNA(Asn)/Glu-tRNA(Gln) amidotransferase A subunit family amidase
VYDEALNSLITVNPDALDRAEELDAEFEDSGPVGPLHGVPIVLKDNYDTGDMPTTAGSLSLEGSVPPDDSFLVEQLRDGGGIVLAKANLDEFASGIEGASSLGGQTRNAYALGQVPGGSSAGTGASIAASLGVIGTGSDTCGSIRNPSAFGSLVGIRPTLGLLSRDGIIPLILARDTGGPLTRTVADAALALDVMAGYDPSDPITARGADEMPSEEDRDPADSYTDYLNKDGLEGLRVGVLRDFFGAAEDAGEEQDGVTQDEAEADAAKVTAVIESAIEDMDANGAEIVDDLSIDSYDELTEAADAPSSFQIDLNNYLDSLGDDAPYDTVEEIYESEEYACFETEFLSGAVEDPPDPDLKESEAYLSATGGKVELRDAVRELMVENDVDVLLYPTLSRTPVDIGSDQNGSNCTLSAYSGLPSIVVPAGYTQEEEYPVGLELLGLQFDEPLLIETAYSYEQATMNRKTPDGFGSLPAETPEVPNPDFSISIAENGCSDPQYSKRRMIDL